MLALARRFVLPISRAELGEYFFPLAALFALHALPVRGSIPYQIVQKHPLNLLYIAAILCGAGLGLSALRVRDDDGVVRAFYICSLSVLCGPLLDLLMTAKAVAVFATTGVWPPPPAVPTPVNASVEKRGDHFRVFLNPESESDPLTKCSKRTQEMIKETDGVSTVWIPPTEAQWQLQAASPHPRAGTCFYANLRRRCFVRVDADGFPVVRPLEQGMLSEQQQEAAAAGPIVNVQEVFVNSSAAALLQEQRDSRELFGGKCKPPLLLTCSS